MLDPLADIESNATWLARILCVLGNGRRPCGFRAGGGFNYKWELDDANWTRYIPTQMGGPSIFSVSRDMTWMATNINKTDIRQPMGQDINIPPVSPPCREEWMKWSGEDEGCWVRDDNQWKAGNSSAENYPRSQYGNHWRDVSQNETQIWREAQPTAWRI